MTVDETVGGNGEISPKSNRNEMQGHLDRAGLLYKEFLKFEERREEAVRRGSGSHTGYSERAESMLFAAFETLKEAEGLGAENLPDYIDLLEKIISGENLEKIKKHRGYLKTRRQVDAMGRVTTKAYEFPK